MLANQLTEQEMRKEIRRLKKNLSKRLERIKGLHLEAPISQTAVNRFEKLDIPKNLNTLNQEDLLRLYRDLVYIDSLKSSTVKGAKNAQRFHENVMTPLSGVSKETQDKILGIINKVYESLGENTDYFKYELQEVIIDLAMEGVDPDKIVNDIIQEYNKTLFRLGDKATDAKVKISFTKRLQKLREHH